MNYKYSINILNLLVILTIIFNFNCVNDANTLISNGLESNLNVLNLSKGYKLSLKKDRFEFNKIKNNAILSGEYFIFQTLKKIPYKTIIISNSLRNSSSELVFKLYINNKFLGKFQENDTITINKEVSSIKIFYLKSGFENIYNAWDINYTYKFIKNDRQNRNNKLKIKVFLINKNNYNSVSVFKSNKNKFAKLKPVVKYQIFPKTITTSIITSKKSLLVTESSFIFYSDGSFNIHQLEASKKSKKIIKDFFYEGNWYVKKHLTKTILELSGYISGYFSRNEDKYTESEFFNCKAVIENNTIISNRILSSFKLDIPDSSFVNIKEFVSNIIVEMPYSTKKNFTGVKLYPCNKCYLRYKVAKDLIKVSKAANKLKYKLKIFDCYRPFFVQAIMFKKFPVKGYVADSIWGSIHNRGGAIDLTITNKQGKEINMGTQFDDLSYKSNHNFKYFSDTILNNRLILKKIMIENNFVPINSEWWHYNHINARDYKKVNLNFPCK